jgi:hypothetical protein
LKLGCLCYFEWHSFSVSGSWEVIQMITGWVPIKLFWSSQWVGNWGAHNSWVCGLNHIWNSLLDWCLDGLCLLEASANCAKLLGQDHFAELNQHVVTTERAWEVHQKSLGLGTNLSFFGGDSEFRAVLCVCLNL